MNCKIEPNDGSFYVTLLRDGENSETVTYSSIDKSFITITHNKPLKKMVRISYHSSGCVLYRYTEISPNYFEPITRLTQPNVFAAWSIPAINKLDKVPVSEEEDLILYLQPNNERIEFTLILAPWNHAIDENNFAIRYGGILSLIIIPSRPNIPLPKEIEEHFTTLAPNTGLFAKQVLPNDQALIEYHQKINNTQGLIIYSPNMEGVYTIITAVPMRAAPKIGIEYFDNQYKTKIISCKNNVVKFKVKNKHGHTVKCEVPIKNIKLDSRL